MEVREDIRGGMQIWIGESEKTDRKGKEKKDKMAVQPNYGSGLKLNWSFGPNS